MWHSHLLSPLTYLNDYSEGKGVSPIYLPRYDFPLAKLAQLTQSEVVVDETSRSVWEKHFPGQPYQLWAATPRSSAHETSTPLLDRSGAITGNTAHEIGFSIDLIQAVKRQRKFTDKIIALANLKTREGMDKASRRYYQFMMLMKTDNRGMLVPTLDIDLFWHTHQLFNSSYLWWCEKHIGARINHDDTIDQKGLSQGRAHTRGLWLKTYGEAYGNCSHQTVGKPRGHVEMTHVSTSDYGQVLSVYAVGNQGDDDSDSAEYSAGCGDGCGGGCGGEGGCGNNCGTVR
jgi:hypothetical protein